LDPAACFSGIVQEYEPVPFDPVGVLVIMVETFVPPLRSWISTGPGLPVQVQVIGYCPVAVRVAPLFGEVVLRVEGMGPVSENVPEL